jgi:hypothetical protein
MADNRVWRRIGSTGAAQSSQEKLSKPLTRQYGIRFGHLVRSRTVETYRWHTTMALFTFRDLQPAPATLELRAALGLSPKEPLLARRLRGTGKHDRGRRVIELVVPSRLPAKVSLRAEGLLCDNLDLAAPAFKYGEYFDGDLRERYHADEAVALHDWSRAVLPEYAPDPEASEGEVPGLVLVSETEDECFHVFAVQFFFEPQRAGSELRRIIKRQYGTVRRAYLASRPGDPWWLSIGRV